MFSSSSAMMPLSVQSQSAVGASCCTAINCLWPAFPSVRPTLQCKIVLKMLRKRSAGARSCESRNLSRKNKHFRVLYRNITIRLRPSINSCTILAGIPCLIICGMGSHFYSICINGRTWVACSSVYRDLAASGRGGELKVTT